MLELLSTDTTALKRVKKKYKCRCRAGQRTETECRDSGSRLGHGGCSRQLVFLLGCHRIDAAAFGGMGCPLGQGPCHESGGWHQAAAPSARPGLPPGRTTRLVARHCAMARVPGWALVNAHTLMDGWPHWMTTSRLVQAAVRSTHHGGGDTDPNAVHHHRHQQKTHLTRRTDSRTYTLAGSAAARGTYDEIQRRAQLERAGFEQPRECAT